MHTVDSTLIVGGGDLFCGSLSFVLAWGLYVSSVTHLTLKLVTFNPACLRREALSLIVGRSPHCNVLFDSKLSCDP